jgi:thymidine kinase
MFWEEAKNMSELAKFDTKRSLPCYQCGKEAHIFVHYGTDYEYNPETKRNVKKKEIWIALCSKHFKELQLFDKIKERGE